MAESLRGKLILASPALRDPNFVRSVVLIAEHTDEGAMGLVLNRPAAATVGGAVPHLPWLAGGGTRRRGLPRPLGAGRRRGAGLRRRPGRRDRGDRARRVRSPRACRRDR